LSNQKQDFFQTITCRTWEEKNRTEWKNQKATFKIQNTKKSEKIYYMLAKKIAIMIIIFFNAKEKKFS
jgi:hypothetical protein